MGAFEDFDRQAKAFEEFDRQARGMDFPAPAPAPAGVGEILWKNVQAAPGRMWEDLKALPGQARDLINTVSRPSTALPLLAGGPGSTVVRRLGAFAVGKMLERPSTSPVENLATAATGVVGDPRQGLISMLTSPALTEAAVPAIGYAARWGPWAKALINEGQSQELLGTIGRANRVAREAIETAPVSELQKPPRTAAALKRGFESGAVEEATGQRFGDVLDRVAAAAGNPALNSPALREAYDNMPPLAQSRLVGAIGPGGFTLQQAQAIRSWVAGPAFAQSTLGQGVGKVPQQRLTGEITQEMEGALSHAPRALQLWRANNRAFAATEAVQEGLTQGNAFTTQPNRTFLNRSALSDYLAKNEKDLVARMGRERFDDLVEHVLGGGQPGTRDLLASGAGTPGSALLAWLRGTNTGSTQVARVPLATAAPGIGGQYTGSAPYTLPASAQSILDVILQRAGGAALGNQR